MVQVVSRGKEGNEDRHTQELLKKGVPLPRNAPKITHPAAAQDLHRDPTAHTRLPGVSGFQVSNLYFRFGI